ncbi:hypothetical protein [Thermoflexus sp.]|uniref:hypothetical protein n=1 Tax=Thermoflexus sp. TaxID=1969742 RepID=UPI00175890E4|nr:hypothetical protein [Thermoflexus sp.]
MISPNRTEVMWFALGLVWFVLVGPLLIGLLMQLGLWPKLSFWIAFIYVLIWILLAGVGLSLYALRVTQEMGMGGLVVTVIWIGLAILLARELLTAFRSVGR